MPMNPVEAHFFYESRRRFLGRGANVLGFAALASLLGRDPHALAVNADKPLVPHFAPKAKQVIYLHMVGGPSQMDLFDPKPEMAKWYDKDLPDSIRHGQRLTTMTTNQARFPVAPSMYRFTEHGRSGMSLNAELLPNLSQCADDLCLIRSMNTESINHEPAITFMQTGNPVTGRPCLGAWASYGLGSLNQNLPTFVVLVAEPSFRDQFQAISAKLWSAGYLPGEHAGVAFRSKGDPILYINNPRGVPAEIRRQMIDGVNALNQLNYEAVGDPETHTRIAQYEMAYRMQASVPELTDLSGESATTLALYGDEVKKAGTFANSALLARRLVERGVRFVQIYHNNWDHHFNIGGRLPTQCHDIDRPCYGLLQDLKLRGLLDETLIIWGGEFGRTMYSQGHLSSTNYGRDHHPRCFSMWMAGGGTKGGTVYGETDDFCYNIARDPVSVHDLHATILHLLGFDHRRLTYRYQGLESRLTGVEAAQVVTGLLA
jgi:hypothetical protein